ncbi:sporulation protein YunB [Scopulibacillus cellulosilyticus]|uniref:Sporulation protein YunB n=1 Tax=Scopulibacillus cellulosilyticus TaxID=2665665 RepID=A0ABW2Q152_9BACL
MFKPMRRRRSVALRNAFVLTMVMFIIFTMGGFWFINKQVSPTLIEIAKNEAAQIETYAINYGVGKQPIKNLETNDDIKSVIDPKKLIIIQYNDKKEVTNVSYNTAEINRLKAEVTDRVQTFLRMAEDGEITIQNGKLIHKKTKQGIVAEIPLGQASENALLTNLSPRIPVKLDVLGNVNVDAKSKQVVTGINNTYIRIYLTIKVNVNVILPFAASNQPIEQTIPIAEQFIPGQVPYYYNQGSGGSGNDVTIPMSPKNNKSPKTGK